MFASASVVYEQLMRIALTHLYSWPEVRRGGERYLHELASALARRDNDVTIISSALRPSIAVEERVRVVRIKRKTSFPREDFFFGPKILPTLLRQPFDAVHSLGASDAAASVVASWFRRKRTTVYTNLGVPEPSAFDERHDRHHHDFMCKRIDVYGCLSEFAARSFEQSYGRRATLTPGGVRLDRFKPGRQRAERPTLLYSGVISFDAYRKGVSTLLEAAALLVREVPDLQIWLSGAGDATRFLDEAPHGIRERTTVYGIDGPPIEDLYASTWVTVLPSLAEAFGLVIIESLAAGTPVVGTTSGALPELVSDDIGAMSIPFDAASLADACRRVLELSREPDIAERCRAAAEPHDWETAIAPRFERIYRGEFEST